MVLWNSNLGFSCDLDHIREDFSCVATIKVAAGNKHRARRIAANIAKLPELMQQ
jgi:hypothetical protein